MRILVIEDEKSLAAALKALLEKRGYAVDTVHDGAEAVKRLELYSKDYDLVVLDWILPQRSGQEILQHMRRGGMTVPVLMLTGKYSVADRVAGLRAGADDYLIKPFSPNELIARIEALLRRPAAVLQPKLQMGNLVLDPQNFKAWCDGREVKLTLKEFSLLEYLMRNPNRVLDREQIFTHLWDFNNNALSNVIDVHVYSLRKKISVRKKNMIETVKGVGYRLNV